MSDELTLKVSLSFSKGGTSVSLALGPTDFDVAGTNAIHHRQSIGITEEALLLGDVAVGGYLIAVNRDATNFIEIRGNTGIADLIRLEPGDFCMFRVTDDAVPYAIADTGACELEYALIDA